MNSSHSRHPLRALFILLALSVLVLPLAFLRVARVSPADSASCADSPPSSLSGDRIVTPAQRVGAVSPPTSASVRVPRSSTADAIQDALRGLQVSEIPASSGLLLERLKRNLLNNDSKTDSVGAIVRFLDSGADAPTKLKFRVGQGHALTESPTLRTALLDWLGQLDPAAAAAYSERIFEAMASQEEYALALRNFARGRPAQKAELRGHFERFLSHGDWAGNPTAGFVEAFDVAPYLGDPGFVQPLGAMLGSSTKTPLRHASLVALDRLVIANPVAALAELLQSNAVDSQPKVRASFFARADIRDPQQRHLVERYLASSSLPKSEADEFMALFPNANRFVSHNLLTDSGSPSLAEIASMDAAALHCIRSWRSDARFEHLRPPLHQMESRVQQQAASATQTGYLPAK